MSAPVRKISYATIRLFWLRGLDADEIAKVLGCSTAFVEKAMRRNSPAYKPSGHDESFETSHDRRKAMDAAFKQRMLKAIRRGTERAVIGVYKSNRPDDVAVRTDGGRR